MKKIFIAVLILICATCAGCFNVKFDLKITDSGAVYQRCRFIGTPAIRGSIENWRNQAEKNNPNLKINSVAESNMSGYEFEIFYPDIETFAKDVGDFYAVNVGKNKGISQHKSWFFDEYDFDFYWKGTPASSSFDAAATQAILSQAAFDFTISLPYVPDSNNADTVGSDGKFLRWNLAQAVISGGEKYMNVRFKLWHKDKIALTVAVELMLLAATIFFFVKAREEELETTAQDLRFKRNVFAGLFLVLVLISAYMILTPVVFSDADIISKIP